VLAGLLPRTKS